MREDIIDERKKSLERLKDAGIDPYPPRLTVGALQTIREVLGKFDGILFSLLKPTVAVAGRIMSWRQQGSIIFANLADDTGHIQIVLKRDSYADFDAVSKLLDRGDFIAVSGTIFITKKQEKSIQVRQLQILTKSIRPIPTE